MLCARARVPPGDEAPTLSRDETLSGARDRVPPGDEAREQQRSARPHAGLCASPCASGRRGTHAGHVPSGYDMCARPCASGRRGTILRPLERFTSNGARARGPPGDEARSVPEKRPGSSAGRRPVCLRETRHDRKYQESGVFFLRPRFRIGARGASFTAATRASRHASHR